MRGAISHDRDSRRRGHESAERDLEKPHFAANLTSENPVKQGFLAKYCLRKQGFSKLPERVMVLQGLSEGTPRPSGRSKSRLRLGGRRKGIRVHISRGSFPEKAQGRSVLRLPAELRPKEEMTLQKEPAPSAGSSYYGSAVTPRALPPPPPPGFPRRTA